MLSNFPEVDNTTFFLKLKFLSSCFIRPLLSVQSCDVVNVEQPGRACAKHSLPAQLTTAAPQQPDNDGRLWK